MHPSLEEYMSIQVNGSGYGQHMEETDIRSENL